MSTRTISITIGKETLEFPVNHSSWISTEKGANPLPKGWTAEKLIGLERLRYNSKHIPTVVIGTREVKLGTEFLTPEEKDEFNRLNRISRGNGGGTRSGGSTKNAEVREALLKFQETLKGNAKKELGDILEKYFPAPEMAAAKAALEKLTPEQKAALMALLG